MPFPKDLRDLYDSGYTYNVLGTCNACKARIQWWTTPKGKLMPINIGKVEPHWATCPDAKKFRKK